MEYGAHPLCVAPGQVVVDRDDVDAPTRQAVQDRGQRRGQGLAFAGLHLGDLALMQDDGAHELDVEMAHAQGPLHGLARGGEDFRQRLVHGFLETLMLALQAVLGDFAAAFQVGVMALVVGWLLGLAGVADLLADFLDEGADLLVGARLHLGLQVVDPLHERFNSMELAVVRVDEAAQEAKHWDSRSVAARVTGLRPGPRPRRRRPSASTDVTPPIRPGAAAKV